ncbi:SRPBCC domain-containing protein [Agrococcus jenensis]|uniref:Activator of Hsp90 ATPase-like protein n=1 Tax=Agrococcus jenensis TaxID=46353 RepID=A0A3N2ASY6_9MICO|nr:SRPBCC domain-containing protein [Agrococcus jenensis]ROR66149.1 activator of Hsp90 ATPase-like protein [Agrococcus jenensis]
MAIARTGTVTEHGESAELALERRVAADAIAVWPFLTESRELGMWFGTYAGDPDSGEVVMSMTAEEGDATTAVEILDCHAPEHLAVLTTDEHGSWSLEVEVLDGGHDAGSGATIRFTHHDVALSALPDIGAGWEWYLDRLVAALAGQPMPDWDDYYPALRDAYAA